MNICLWIFWITSRIMCVNAIDSDIPGTKGKAVSPADDTWDWFVSSRYKFVADMARKVDTTRNNAERYCHSLGASLVSIQTNEELEWLKLKIKDKVASIGEEFAHQQWWTSGKVDYGVWAWDDPKLTPVTITALRKITPGKRDHEHFLSLTHDNDGWRLRGFPDNYKLRFICEKEMPQLDFGFRASIEQKLMRYLSRESDVSERDVGRSEEVLAVNTLFTLKTIIELDESRQVLSTSAVIGMEWTDKRLSWNESDFHNVSLVHYQRGQMWVPDIIILNSIDDRHLDESMETHLWVTSTGSVHWHPEGAFSTLCQTNIRRFPFDHQWCSISLGTHHHYNFNVTFTARDSGIDVSKMSSSHGWYISGTRAVVTNTKMECCSEKLVSRITISIHLGRRVAYYVVILVIPCALLSLLLLVSLWLPYKSGEKLTCIMFVLLAFVVLLNMVCSLVGRPSNYMPLIALYIASMIGIGTIAACTAILIATMIHRQSTQQPDSWRDIIFSRQRSKSAQYEEENIAMETVGNNYEKFRKTCHTQMPCRVNYHHVHTRDCDNQVIPHVTSVSCDALAADDNLDLDLDPDYGVIRKEVELARSLDTLCDDTNAKRTSETTPEVLGAIHERCRHKGHEHSAPVHMGSAKNIRFKDLHDGVCEHRDNDSLPQAYTMPEKLDRIVSSVLSVLTIVVIVSLASIVP